MSVRLFVGNLSFDVTEAELKELFSASGPPSYVRIPTDRETGKPRGFAFVEFGDRAQAEDAIRRFNQQLFKGRALAVNEARAREEGAGARPFAPRPAAPGPGLRPAPRPRPTEPLAGSDETGAPGQPRGTFGPDARPRNRRKREGTGVREERVPKGPLRERNTGQIFSGGDEEEGDEELLDDFTLWKREEPKDDES
ncbi:MAG: RNA-binding protein [Thermodesulfobacteriota bacterium]